METKPSAGTFFFFFLLLLSSIQILVSSANAAAPSLPTSLNGSTVRIPAVFVFGDSTLDPGNNDYIETVFKGNHLPYGRDLPGHAASGRFTNGKMTPDFLVFKLGLKELLPAYLDPNVTDSDLLTGAGFASAGTGFDDLTAKMMNVVSVSTQLDQFTEAVGRIQRRVGAETGQRIVSDALYIIGAGTNDMLYNFYVLPTRKIKYSLSEYQDFLIEKVESAVQRLHGLGARRMTITGLPPIGCLPLQRTAYSLKPGRNMFHRVCWEEQNRDSMAYNVNLQAQISRWEALLPGVNIVYADIYSTMMDMISNPTKYGFEVVHKGCCGTGTVEMGPMVTPNMWTCPNASKYMFWDAVHPTQTTYETLSALFHDLGYTN